jgi:hypothetical protein
MINSGVTVALASQCIVIDTNALWGDLRLAGIAWQVLAAATTDTPTCLRFCSTVIDEAVAKFTERADLEARHLTDVTCKYLADAALIDPVLAALQEEVAGFEDYLADRILEGLNARILPYPEVTHEEMTARALRRTPPFDQKGNGYRDSLIWLTALAEAESLEAGLIVVSNDSAFKDPEKGKDIALHPALIAEAAERGVAARLCPTLGYLITQYLYPDAGERADISALAASKALEQIISFLAENLSDPSTTPSMEVQAMGLPPSVTDFKIDYVEDVHDVKLTKLQEIENGRVVHAFTAKCAAELEVSVHEGVAGAFGWPVEERYGHGEVSALVYRSVDVSGLVTLSPFGLAEAAEATEWSADPATSDAVWGEECGCFPRPGVQREPQVIFARRPAMR